MGPATADPQQVLPAQGWVAHVGGWGLGLDGTPFAGLGWTEVACDSLLEISTMAAASLDAVYGPAVVQRLEPQQLPAALADCRRVLKPTGVLLLSCPDLRTLGRLLAEDQLEPVLYVGPTGAIRALDLLYGPPERPHRCGFTEKVLVATLQAAGFAQVASITRSAACRRPDSPRSPV